MGAVIGYALMALQLVTTGQRLINPPQPQKPTVVNVYQMPSAQATPEPDAAKANQLQ